jgi:hypothetical protein
MRLLRLTRVLACVRATLRDVRYWGLFGPVVRDCPRFIGQIDDVTGFDFDVECHAWRGGGLDAGEAEHKTGGFLADHIVIAVEKLALHGAGAGGEDFETLAGSLLQVGNDVGTIEGQAIRGRGLPSRRPR